MSCNLHMDEIRDLFKKIGERMLVLENTARAPEQTIFDDVDLRNFLKVSKRTTAYWREKGIITFSKLGGKIYYRLSDILSLLKQNEISAVDSNLKIVL